MKKNPGVLLTHPGKQHSYQQALALQRNDLLRKFITSFYYKRDKLPFRLTGYLPDKMSDRADKFLSKRRLDGIDYLLIEQFPYFEIVRELFERIFKGYKSDLGIFYINQLHDIYVSGRLKMLMPDIVIGSETACLRTFKKARELNIITVLDVPSVHYRFMNMLRNKYHEYSRTFSDNNMIEREDLLKEKELEYSDYIFCLSGFAKGTLTDQGIPEEKIFVLTPGYDGDFFSNPAPVNSSSKLKLLYVGNISVRKGINLIIEAFNMIYPRDIELTLIGGLTDAAGLLKKIKGEFRHIPYLSHSELKDHYRDADIFVMPSYMDSWGLVVSEAMACGTPAIVSENTGSKELVEDGYNGFVIPVGDPYTLKEKILYLYDNRDELIKFKTRTSSRVGKLDWKNYSHSLNTSINQVFASHFNQ